jgi:iron complex outermembrane receptor protein
MSRRLRSRRLMSRRLAPSWTLVLALSILTTASTAVGQQRQLASRGPRFLLAGWVPGREVDASSAPVLRRRVSLDLTGVTIGEALKELTRQAALEISYSPRMVPLDRPVSLHAQGITVAAALTEILLDVPVDVSVAAGGGLALVRRPPPIMAPEPIDSGAVAGQVTDSASGSPIPGATVSIEGARRSAVTNADGRYRIVGVASGSYTFRARYIGYAPATGRVTVTPDLETTLDLALVRSVQPLDEVVTTGTLLPTEVKALPTPVTVVTSRDIALQRPHTVQELFRQAVPGGVSWALSKSYYLTAFSTRGSATFSGPTAQMKVFVDGVQTALATASGVDPSSIERMEVIRGPQAAALYGSDAIGGVIQIFTKRGDADLTRPQVNAEAGLGIIQTPYAGYDAVARQEYRASVRGGGSDVSYNLGAGYSHTGDWLPNGELSAQSNPSVYGGMRFARGIVSLDLSGRYFVQNYSEGANPEFFQTNDAFLSKPFYSPQQITNQTIGARFGVAATHWWRHTVTVGVARYDLDWQTKQPRRTTPEDTLLQVYNESQTRRSIGYQTSVEGVLSSDVSGSLTAGFDHWSLPASSWYAGGALTTSGTIKSAPGQVISATHTIRNNTGYFAQAQVGLRDRLFFTGGLRAESNSDFGDSLGTPISPQAGLSYVHEIGAATLKVRGSWGRAIRPPSPGRKLGGASATSVTLPAPELGPERQHGWDAGVDAVFGGRGSLSVTYYDQTADNLIQSVLLQTSPVRTFQFQNVGRVGNTGIEIEGTVTAGPVRLKGQYAYARSRIEQLAPGYAGDLRVGDQALGIPKHTAGASLSLSLLPGNTVSTGFTYVGTWSNYDWLAESRCSGGTGPCQPTSRDYIVAYPSFVRVNASVFQEITRRVSGFISADNVTNNRAYEMDNFGPVMGRVTTVGAKWQY